MKSVSLLLSLATLAFAQTPAKPVITPADYGKWETLGQAVLSHDGKWLAHPVTRTDGTFELRVSPTSGGKAKVAAFGKEPAFVREGGSIGAVVTMEKYLKAPIVFLGLSLPEHGYHAPNENFDWEQASGGMKMFAQYFENLVQIPRRRR